MKSILIFIAILFTYSQNPNCGDGTTYVNEKQVKYDKRFAAYPKIESVPQFSGGKEALNKLIEEKLKVSEKAKNIVFRLNFMFTITCDGKIKDFKTLGDPKASSLTNMIEIIESTKGKWTPAKKDGVAVDCIYFAQKTILGSKY